MSGGPTITEYATGEIDPSYIAPGPDGKMWFSGGPQIGTITNSGTVSYLSPSSSGMGMATGDDGAMWFTQLSNVSPGSEIVRMTASGTVSQYTGGNIGPSGPAGPTAIIAHGPDGAMWFPEGGYPTASGIGIGRITTAGAITDYPVTLPNGDIGVAQGIAPGPDNAMWFTVIPSYPSVTSYIGRIATGTHATSVYALSSSSSPFRIAKGPDGAMWFTDKGTNSIGRITTAGAITEYAIPSANANPWGITAGGDGALWFVENNANNIGRVTTTGTFSEYAIPTANTGPTDIAQALDGTIWFNEDFENFAIGHVTFPVTGTRYMIVTQNTPTLTASRGTTVTFTCAAQIRTYDAADAFYHLGDWGYNTHSSGSGTFPIENYPTASYLSWAVPDLSSTYHTYGNSGPPGEAVWSGTSGQDQTHCVDLKLTVPTTISTGTYNAAITYHADGSATLHGLGAAWAYQTINFGVIVN